MITIERLEKKLEITNKHRAAMIEQRAEFIKQIDADRRRIGICEGRNKYLQEENDKLELRILDCKKALKRAGSVLLELKLKNS